MRGAVAWLALALSALGCGDGTGPDPSGGTGTTGSAGGGGGFEAPSYGPIWEHCQPGEAEIDGSCVSSGIPSELCGALFVPDGDGSCDPILPASTCPRGELALLGETRCMPLGQCGAESWSGIPLANDSEYVDQSFVGASTGSALAPWTTIAEAVAAAAPGAIVAIAPGTYLEALELSEKPLALWGKCPGEVVIDGGPTGAAISIHSQTAAIHRVSLTGQIGIRALGTAAVTLEEVRTFDTLTAGISGVVDSAGSPTITARRILIEDSVGRGISGLGGSFTLEDAVIRGTNSGGSGTANPSLEWSHAVNHGPATVTLRRVVIEKGIRSGIQGFGLTLELEDVVLRDFASAPLHSFNQALLLKGFPDTPSVLSASRLVVERTAGGVRLIDAQGALKAFVVRDTVAETGNYLGAVGFDLGSYDWPGPSGPAKASILHASIDRVESHGILAIGAELSLTGVRIRDVVPLSGPEPYSRGIGLEGAAVPPIPFEATINGLHIERAHEAGVAAAGGILWLEGASILHTDDAAFGGFGRGIAVQNDPDAPPTAATIRRTLIDGAAQGGLTGHGVDVTAVDLAVRNVRAGSLQAGACFNFQRMGPNQGTASLTRISGHHCEGFGAVFYGVAGTIRDSRLEAARANDWGGFGDGVATVLSDIELDRVLITTADRAGVATFAGSVRMRDAFLDCNALDLNGEAFAAIAYFFDDLGGNRCGCGAEERPCQILSSGLTPPPSP